MLASPRRASRRNPRKQGRIHRKNGNSRNIKGLVAVLSDECEPVSALPVELSRNICQLGGTRTFPRRQIEVFRVPKIVVMRDEIAFMPDGIAVKPDGFASNRFKPASIRFARAPIPDAVAIKRDATAVIWDGIVVK